MSGGLISFLLQVVIISLSGVVAPGPVTAATLAAGTRSRHAGGLIALGHIIVECPIIVLIMAGMSSLFVNKGINIGINLVGGLFLLLMAVQILKAIGKTDTAANNLDARNPIWMGIVLTGGNPYALFWWVTIGFTLVTRAVELGVLALMLFAIVHWLCDLLWLEALSFTSFKGTRLFGHRSQKIVLAVCSCLMFIIGAAFIIDAGRKLVY